MTNIERACARIQQRGQQRAAEHRPYHRAEAEEFVAQVLLAEGVRPWPPAHPNGDVQFYAGVLILESHRPAFIKVN
jgi:hypothetical protein